MFPVYNFNLPVAHTQLKTYIFLPHYLLTAILYETHDQHPLPLFYESLYY